MYKMIHSTKLLYFLVGLILISGTVGCGTAYDNRYLFQPYPEDRAAIRAIAEKDDDGKFIYKGMEVEVEDGVIHIKDLKISIPLEDVKITVSDADALGFANDVSFFLRKRMNTARRLRLGSATVQILAAAAAGSLGVIAHSDIETISALSAVSAVIPELQSIFKAKGRSEAYRGGLDLIRKAVARYHRKRTAKNGGGKISTKKLTEEGSKLMSEVAASIKAVDTALQQSIPSIEDLKAATGQLEDEFDEFKIVPEKLNILKDGEGTVRAVQDLIIRAEPDDPSIVEIDQSKYGNNGVGEVTIKGSAVGTTNVEIYFDRGYKASLTVEVIGASEDEPTTDTN